MSRIAAGIRSISFTVRSWPKALRLPWQILLGVLLGVLSQATSSAAAQEIHLDLPKPTSPAHAQRVTVEDEPQTIVAGKPQWIELRFHVAPGFHINSHLPHDEMLIATSLDLTKSPTYQVQQEVYPSGEPLELKIGAGETLSTYSGNFRIRVEVLASKGESALAGSLRYQACNAASCFPALDLPVRVSLLAR